MSIPHDTQSFVARSQTRNENPGNGTHTTPKNQPKNLPQTVWVPLNYYTECSALDVAADYDLPLTPITLGGTSNEL